MPMHIIIDPQRRLVDIRAEGRITDADMLEAGERLRSGPEFDGRWDQLIDFTAADGQDISTGVVVDLAQRESLFSPESRRAVVVTSRFGFGMARMFELMREGSSGSIEIFETRKEALAWLGREDT